MLLYNKVWTAEPNLKTTGFIKRFTKELVFHKNLDNQELSDFLSTWKLHSLEEAEALYFGSVYRIKNITPNHLLLQARRRGGSAYHYIDCKYQQESSKIVMEIRSPNSSGYFYICWPLILLFIVFLFSNKSNLEFSLSWLSFALFYASIMILIGAYFLNFSLNSVKKDIQREIHKIKGLSPINYK